ncbi:MAG TPA: hypothetical protein VFT43_14955 [Candidatus Polarisedimenticolia bacterium]|nr:hypothetical protein [Candidatus Polarisedimenticolia bacterium]
MRSCAVVLGMTLGMVCLPALADGAGETGGKAAAPAPGFADQVARARKDIAGKKGAAYDVELNKQFASRHVDTVGSCVEASGESEPVAFQVVIVVAKDGKVSSVSVNPETEVAQCLRKALLQETFPKPPFAPFYDLLEMSFE